MERAERAFDALWRRFTGPHGGAFALGLLVGATLMAVVLTRFVYEPRLAERDAMMERQLAAFSARIDELGAEIDTLKEELRPYREEGRDRLLRGG